MESNNSPSLQLAHQMPGRVRLRWKGEGDPPVGLLARPERIIILAAGLILGHPIWALWLLAIFTNVTAFQRIYHLWSTTTHTPRKPSPNEGR